LPNQKKSIPIPGEHGAWAILYGSFLLATFSVLQVNSAWLLILVAMTGLFLAHSPFSKLLRSPERTPVDLKKHWFRWLAIYLSLCLIPGLGLILFYHFWFLIPIGAVTAILLAVHLYWSSRHQERTLGGEILGVLALTSTAFVTHSVISKQLSLEAAVVWVLAGLYFASGVFYVRMRVSRFMKKDQFRIRRILCLSYHGVLVGVLAALAFFGQIPQFLPFTYLPVLIRALWFALVSEEKLNIKKIGYTEVAQTIGFVLLFAFLWHW